VPRRQVVTPTPEPVPQNAPVLSDPLYHMTMGYRRSAALARKHSGMPLTDEMKREFPDLAAGYQPRVGD